MPGTVTRCGGGGGGSFPGTVLSPAGGGLTLDADVPAAGHLQVVFLSSSLGGDGGTGRFPSAASDGSGKLWTVVTLSDPLIGLAEMDIGTGTNISSIMVGSVARHCTAGDLLAGDAISVTWANTGSGSFDVVYVVVFMPVGFTIVDQRGAGPAYSNGLGYPFAASSAGSLSWPVDSFQQPNPDQDAFSLGAFAAYPSGAFSPSGGYVIGTANGAGGDLTVTGLDNLPASADFDPGGTFAGSPAITIGNYQTVPALGGGGGGGGGRRLARCSRCSRAF